MNNIQIFNFEEQQVRTIVVNNVVWFVGKDVATILGYANASKAVIAHVDEEDKRFEMLKTSDSQNGNLVKTALINESGLYSLVLKSKLPSAKRFKRWVTSEVLPSIRKTGSYQMDNSEEIIKQSILDPDLRLDLVIEFATALKEEKQKTKVLEAENQIMQPKAECFDTFLDTGELTGFRDSAHLLNISERKFMTFLEDAGFIYRNEKNKPRAYAKYLDKGYFDVKAVKCFDGKSRDQTFITPLGLSVIHKKYQDQQRLLQITE